MSVRLNRGWILLSASRPSRVALSSAFALLLAVLGVGNQAWADPGMINLAAGKTATATNTDFGATVGAGIDGNRDGNFGNGSVYYGNSPNSEGTDNNPNTTYFYQVDLGQNNYVNRVQFLPRTDADQNVFGNFNISIFPDDGTGNPAAQPSFSHDYNANYFGDSFATLDPGASAPGGANGRFVRITRLDNNYWMTFAEMEVIGSSTPLQHTEADNLAVGKPVTTSSVPGFGALITSGNDGNIDGSFGAGIYRPVYHSSNHSVGEFWQVDLGANKALSYAELFARTNVNTTSEFKVSVLDSSMTVVDSVIVDNSDVNGPTPGYDHTIDLTGVSGEFVRIETTSDSYLAFSELQVFGGAATFAPGDYNHDGVVNIQDYNTWKQAFGTNNSAADGNGNGVVDAADYAIWRAHLPAGSGAGSLGSASVPEPTSAMLLLGFLALVPLARRRG